MKKVISASGPLHMLFLHLKSSSLPILLGFSQNVTHLVRVSWLPNLS